MEVVSFKTHLLYPQGKSPWHLLDRRLGGHQSGSEYIGQETIYCPSWESNNNFSHLASGLVTILIELSGLLIK
jgi:hypothetical protein